AARRRAHGGNVHSVHRPIRGPTRAGAGGGFGVFGRPVLGGEPSFCFGYRGPQFWLNSAANSDQEGSSSTSCPAVGRGHRRSHRLWTGRHFSWSGRACGRIHAAAIVDGRRHNYARRGRSATPLNSDNNPPAQGDVLSARGPSALRSNGAITMEQRNDIYILEILASGDDAGRTRCFNRFERSNGPERRQSGWR